MVPLFIVANITKLDNQSVGRFPKISQKAFRGRYYYIPKRMKRINNYKD